MPERPQTSFAQFQKALPQISTDAAAAPARALAGLGQTIQGIGGKLADWQAQMYEVENKKKESEVRQQWDMAYADARNEMMQMAPAERGAFWSSKLEELKGTIDPDSLAEVSRDRLEIEWNNFTAKSSIQVERDAAMTMLNDARQISLNEYEQAVRERNYDRASQLISENVNLWGAGVADSKMRDLEYTQQTDEWMLELREDPEAFKIRVRAGEVTPDFAAQDKLMRLADQEMNRKYNEKISAFEQWQLQQDEKGVVLGSQELADAAKRFGLPDRMQLQYLSKVKPEMTEEQYDDFEARLVSNIKKRQTLEYGDEEFSEIVDEMATMKAMIDQMPPKQKDKFQDLIKLLGAENENKTKTLIFEGNDEIEYRMVMGQFVPPPIIPDKATEEEEKRINEKYKLQTKLAKNKFKALYIQKMRELMEKQTPESELTPRNILNAVLTDDRMQDSLSQYGIRLSAKAELIQPTRQQGTNESNQPSAGELIYPTK